MKIAALSLIVLLMAGFGALPLYLVWWLPKRRSEAWAAAAAALGLELKPPPTPHHPVFLGPLVGVRDGFEVTCAVRVTPGQTTTYYTQIVVQLGRSLEADLYVRPVGGLGRLWAAATGEDDIQLGEPDLDPAYEIRGSGLDDRVRLLLGEPDVIAALRAHTRSAFGLQLDDRRVLLEAYGLHLQPEALAPAMDAGIDVAKRLLRAHDQVRNTPQWSATVLS